MVPVTKMSLKNNGLRSAAACTAMHAEQLDQRMRGANAAAASNLETVASPGRPGKLVGAAPGGGLAIGGGSGASGQLLATLQIVEAVRRGVEILANVVSPESRSSPSPPLRHAC